MSGGKLREGTPDRRAAFRQRVIADLGSATDPAAVNLPPYYPRDPVLLEDWALYLDAVRYTDKLVGDVLKRLDDEGLTANTLVIFMTDHGISHARGKQFLYDEGTHIPLVVRGPGVAAGVQRSDLVEHIHHCVASVNLPHRAIQLEITEDNLMKELRNVIPSLQRLNELGVEIAIDDFGTGYSSLAYLTTLPISEVKIDRSFVRDLGVTPQSSAVVTAIIALARSLGLRVVAEGVETLRQMEVLHRLGCSVMQGFLFSRAVPADELQRWLERAELPRRASWADIGLDGGTTDHGSVSAAAARRLR